MHSFVNVIYSIPILPTSGKFDRTKLPPVDITNSETDQEGMPTTPTEKALAPLWCEVLRLKTIDVQESFFDLGGLVVVLKAGLHNLFVCFRCNISKDPGPSTRTDGLFQSVLSPFPPVGSFTSPGTDTR